VLVKVYTYSVDPDHYWVEIDCIVNSQYSDSVVLLENHLDPDQSWLSAVLHTDSTYRYQW